MVKAEGKDTVKDVKDIGSVEAVSPKKWGLLEIDPWLAPFEGDVNARMERYHSEKARLLGGCADLSTFANGALYFGFHKGDGGDGFKWTFREWAPNAARIHLIGDFNGWDRNSHELKPLGDGVFELRTNEIKHGDKVKIQITTWDQRVFDRVPLYCNRVVQNSDTKAFDGQVWQPDKPFDWTDEGFVPDKGAPFIYECHIGMSGEDYGIASYRYFEENVLPRVHDLGYNAVQIMAVMEHAYYASFGYQVTNFFAASSRFGTPEDLKRLIDKAHSMGISVFLDVVHSHASSNVLDGIGEFDGTDYQFFHKGGKGDHPAWGSKVFNYGKSEVVHFLLSNIKFWLTEYHFDGFRFDGVTSMLYHDHALGTSFDNYAKYFSMNTDVEAVTYLQLAAELAKSVRPHCVLIAEDMSAMPGMCVPIDQGGIGFDYRLNMGMPDFWIKTLKFTKDEFWNLDNMWHELTTRRPKEKTIGYCESHDQALVGDKTIMFWLADAEMYRNMSVDTPSYVIDRAIALHKMIRLITCAASGDGYLNFMGNEFGHPEWIDFPREGNGNSFHYARRQWSLADNRKLRYGGLARFDRAMITLLKSGGILDAPTETLMVDGWKNVVAFRKGAFIFVFNFHPTEWRDVTLRADGTFETALDSNWKVFEGWVDDREIGVYRSVGGSLKVKMYNRSAVVLRKTD